MDADTRSMNGSEPSPPALCLDQPHDLSRWEWIGLPLAVLAYRFLSPLLGYETWSVLNQKEFGVLEMGTVLVLLIGLYTTWRIWSLRDALPGYGTFFMMFGGFCVFYYLGEEISWGQHSLGYETPENTRAVTEQEEFNLHNMSGTEIFDNIPRQAMLVGTIIGGIILPIVYRKRLKRPAAPRKLGYWLVPNYRLIPISLFAVLSTVPEKIVRNMYPEEGLAKESYWNLTLVDEVGEVKELLFAGVMAFFLRSVALRLASMRDALSQNDGEA